MNICKKVVPNIEKCVEVVSNNANLRESCTQDWQLARKLWQIMEICEKVVPNIKKNARKLYPILKICEKVVPNIGKLCPILKISEKVVPNIEKLRESCTEYWNLRKSCTNFYPINIKFYHLFSRPSFFMAEPHISTFRVMAPYRKSDISIQPTFDTTRETT